MERTKFIQIRVSDAEKKKIEENARKESTGKMNYSVSDYVRDKALKG